MKSNDSTLVLVLDTLSQLGGEASLLVEIYSLIGREATLKLMEYFKGVKVQFPSENFIDERLVHVRGYVLYELQKKDWNSVIQELYGDEPSRADIKKLGSSIRSIKKRMDKLNVLPNMITEKAIDRIKDDLHYIKEEVDARNTDKS